MVYKLDFHTGYHQFYISDADSDGDTGSDNFWTKEAFRDRLAIESGVLGVGIGSYGHVKAELEILQAPDSQANFSTYDHVVEGGLSIVSGLLQIVDCPYCEVELTIAIEPGNYRVRVYSSGLGEYDADEDEGDDFYRIEIWPDDNMARSVLKRCHRNY
jgi:hypothetical protein